MAAFMCLANFILEQQNAPYGDDQKYLERARAPGNPTCTALGEIPVRSSEAVQAKQPWGLLGKVQSSLSSLPTPSEDLFPAYNIKLEKNGNSCVTEKQVTASFNAIFLNSSLERNWPLRYLEDPYK